MTVLELEQTCEELRATLLDTLKKLDEVNLRPARMLDEREAAAYLGVSPGTIRVWRDRNYGPRCVEWEGKEPGNSKKIIRYDIKDLDRWATECPRRKGREA